MAPRKSRFGISGGRDWTPSNPDAATGRRAVPAEAPDTSADAGWVAAPSTSHLARFQLVSPDSAAFVARYAGSVIRVEFRDDGGRARFRFYQYFFGDDHLRAQKIFDDLCVSPHPYGQILTPQVIQAGVRYEPFG